MKVWTRIFAFGCIMCCGQPSLNEENYCMLKHILKKYTGIGVDEFEVNHIVQLLDSMMAEYDLLFTHDQIRNKRRRETVGTFNHEDGDYLCEATAIDERFHRCVSGNAIMAERGYTDSNTSLSIAQINELAPTLFYQLAMTPCARYSHSFLRDDNSTDDGHNDTDTHEEGEEDHETDGRLKAWLGAIGAVIIISIAGLGVIGVIPLMKKSLYDVLIQFLVALAVGTLVGDALLHLLPHALSAGHDHGSDEEGEIATSVKRGLVSLSGILLFFNAERILGIITMLKNKKKAENSQDIKADGSCSSCGNDQNIILGHSSHEIKAMAHAEHQKKHSKRDSPDKAQLDPVSEVPVKRRRNNKRDKREKKSDHAPDEQTLSQVESEISTTSKAKKKKKKKDRQSKTRQSGSRISHPTDNLSSNANDEDDADSNHLQVPTEDQQDEQLEELEAGDAGDGEDASGMHHHSHDVPDSFTSVAYMVMMGDGLHNFTDGMAIGAAFASSFSGGMSTAVAVLCHELPHELGDFAILLRSGMSVKQAFLCNLLSAGLQLVGVVFGVALGGLDKFDISQSLFAFAGGIFLYIGLVDMLPELSKVDKSKPWRQLCLQDLGLFCGMGIMTLIAVFEDDLETIFGVDNPHAEH